MERNDYISSGILELYAAGALSDTESADVERAIRSDKAVLEEYEKIIRTINLTAAFNLQTPSPDVKSNLLKKLETGKFEHEPEPVSSESNSYRYLIAACIAFLVISLAANYYFWNRLKSAENEIAVLSDRQKIMTQEVEAVSKKLQLASNDMKIMTDKNFKMIEMSGMERSPGSKAVAFWNPASGKVYVGVSSLPVPPPDKQYQLWGISGGKPVDAGVMDVDPSDNSLHEMKSLPDAQAFAITLEPKGGSEYPAMDQMYVMGKL